MSEPQRIARVGWWVLGALLVLTLGRAATAPRERWPGLVGDEPTYLMQASSLALDGDLRFGPEDLARFRERKGHSPEVILQSGDGGARIVYGKPFLYALAIAPLVRLFGERGALIANAVALSAAGLLSALALARRGSAWGPAWIAVVLFASVAFGHVYWIHPDLFLMAAAACGLALAHLLRAAIERRGALDQSPRAALSWGAVGMLLALPGVWRPPYLLLLVPGAWLAAGVSVAGPRVDRGTTGNAPAPGQGRWRQLAVLVAGAALVAAFAVGGQQLVSGSWSPYAGERRGFSELEGYPGIDFPASEWSQRVESKGNTSWLAEGTLEASASPSLVGWNLVYLFLGRTVGLLPYFLPALAAMIAALGRRCGTAARIEVACGLAVALSFMVMTPFNFYGGAGALANRYFLPAFPLFWFAGAGIARCVATVLLAAPFLAPLWLAPAAYPIVAGEGYRYVSRAARRWLPIETTQRHVKAPGRPDALHGDLWVRFLDGGVAEAPDALALAPRRTAEILVGRSKRLDGVSLESLDGATALRASGPGPSEPAAASPKLTVRFDHTSSRHPMWWTEQPFWIYRLTLESPSESSATVPVRMRALDGAARD